ncbi:SAM-dependent methyltransferase [Methanomicrobium sp. W14]|uniref:methyltransferase n=1 Tax=Methanomicrobium sp. W14 TaxID=2817839 RepID=UPI001AE2F583|nr:methyltransferase [Methanomicrobium sp. W14]MBP2133069.1 SAM-dependent methyltransferase [Methanomicrobium sp. W14]
MKELPEINESLTKIYDLSLSPVRANALAAGVKMLVFDYLTKPATSKSVAERCGYNANMTEEFLNVLTACGLLEKKDGKFVDRPDTGQFLVSESPTYYGKILLREYRRISMSPEEIIEAVKNGPVSQKEDDNMCLEDFWTSYARSVANWERSGSAQKLGEIVSELPQFDSFKHMLDLGGGPGLMGMAVLSRHKSMTGVVFDQPAVAKVAEEFIAGYDMSKRMTAAGGDYIRDDFGDGYDLILCSCTLNFALWCMDEIVEKIYNALNPGGVFVSLHDGICDEGTAPEYHVLNMMSSALSGFNCGIKKGLIASSMKKAGFKEVNSREVSLDVGPFDLDIAVKGP